MSKFNATKKPVQPNAVTYEGGAAFEKSLEEDWLNNLFSNMLENRFYESAEDQMARYMSLTQKMLEKHGPKFIARAAVFARNELGMRSISQLTAAMLNSEKFEGKRSFYKNYMRRPDDVSEIFAILESFGEKRSHALVRGAGDYISGLSGYQVDKYRMTNKNWSMIDLINITHPKSEVVDKFYNGKLEKAGTWEQKISASKSKEEKNENWRELVEQEKLGYLALIRNLNNILAANVSEKWVQTYLIPQLTNVDKIHKSLVFPYQIYVAYKNLEVKEVNTVFALDKAFRAAVDNVPGLEGSSLVVLDVSGSMESHMSSHGGMTIKEVCACYAAAIYLANSDSDFIKFGTYAKKFDYNRLDNVFNLIHKMEQNDGCDISTNINPVWDMLDKHYDRIFLFSDEQVMNDRGYYGYYWWSSSRDERTSVEAMRQYFGRYGRTRVYSFDLSNYSTQIDNPDSGNIVMLTALTDKVFTMLDLLERGGSIVDYINEKYAGVI